MRSDFRSFFGGERQRAGRGIEQSGVGDGAAVGRYAGEGEFQRAGLARTVDRRDAPFDEMLPLRRGKDEGRQFLVLKVPAPLGLFDPTA